VNSKLRANRPQRGWLARGFSQLELLTTLALAGIMSASVVPKMIPQAGKSTAAYQALRLADDLRHTRLLAMSWGTALTFSADSQSWRVTCAGGGCATALPAAASCPNPTAAVVDPGHRGPFCVALENGVTLSGPASIQFDLLGRPQSSGTVTYQLSAQGATIATVSVAADTGFVSTTVQQ
jgi:Tfp pilus assembly protein FimT